MASRLRVEITPVISTAAISKELAKIKTLIGQKQINIPLKPIKKKVRNSIKNTTSAFKGLLSAVGKVAIWTAATGAVFGTIRALKNLIKEFIILEDQLIAIQRVTNGLSMEKIFNESLDASIELAVGLKEVLSIMEELGRTYADLDEMQLKVAASNAVLLASVTDLTSQSAVSGLIAITQAYNIAIEDSMDIVDGLNVVNNNYAIGAADLTKSLERSAAAAAEVGVSFENLIGYTTAIKTSTRESGSVIGNSLKTIVIRLQSNADAIREVEAAGVAVYGEDGQLRNAEDIISDLAGKWDTLSKNTKVNIGVAAAGKRQYTRFAALMQNFGIATDSANDAISNQGNAMIENKKRLDTVSAQLEILGNLVLDVAKAFGEELKPVLMDIIFILQEATKVLKFFIENARWGLIVFGDFSVIIDKFNKDSSDIGKSMDEEIIANAAENVEKLGDELNKIGRYTSTLESLKELFDKGRISSEEYVKWVERFNVRLFEGEEALKGYSKSLQFLTFGVEGASDEAANAIMEFEQFAIAQQLVASNADGVKVSMDNLINDLSKGFTATQALTLAFKNLGFEYRDFMQIVEDSGVDTFTVDELNAFSVFNTVMRDTQGVTEDSIKAVAKAIDIINLYKDATNLTTQQQFEFTKSLDFLSDLFPKFSGNILKNLDAVVKQSDAWNLAAENQDIYVQSMIDGLIPANRDAIATLKVLNKLLDSDDLYSALVDAQKEYSENVIDTYEEQKEAFGDLIDSQIQELDRLQDALNYEDDVSDLTEEQISLEQQLARMRNDNSIEGVNKRLALEEELAKNKEELEETVQKRDFELRKQNLETLKDIVENDYDMRIDKETELNNLILERLEMQSEALMTDFALLEALEGLLLGGSATGLFEWLQQIGSADFSGIGLPQDNTQSGAGGAFDDSQKFFIDKVILSGGATKADGEAFISGITEYADPRNMTVVVKHR